MSITALLLGSEVKNESNFIVSQFRNAGLSVPELAKKQLNLPTILANLFSVCGLARNHRRRRCHPLSASSLSLPHSWEPAAASWNSRVYLMRRAVEILWEYPSGFVFVSSASSRKLFSLYQVTACRVPSSCKSTMLTSYISVTALASACLGNLGGHGKETSKIRKQSQCESKTVETASLESQTLRCKASRPRIETMSLLMQCPRRFTKHLQQFTTCWSVTHQPRVRRKKNSTK